MKKTLTIFILFTFLAIPLTWAQEKTETAAKAAVTSDKSVQEKRKQAKMECKKEGKKGKELKTCIEEKMKK